MTSALLVGGAGQAARHVARGARLGAAAARHALPRQQASLGLHAHGARLLARGAALEAGRPVTAMPPGRQRGHEREKRAQRAQEAAEEALLKGHAHKDGDKGGDAHKGEAAHRQARQAAERGPGAVFVDPRACAHKGRDHDSRQHKVFAGAKPPGRLLGNARTALDAQFAHQGARRAVHEVAQQAKRAGIAAKEPAEQRREGKQGKQRRRKHRELDRLIPPHGVQRVLDGREGSGEHRRRKREEERLHAQPLPARPIEAFARLLGTGAPQRGEADARQRRNCEHGGEVAQAHHDHSGHALPLIARERRRHGVADALRRVRGACDAVDIDALLVDDALNHLGAELEVCGVVVLGDNLYLGDLAIAHGDGNGDGALEAFGAAVVRGVRQA